MSWPIRTMPMTTADKPEGDKPEIDNQIERIRAACTSAFGMTEIDISKNPRMRLKTGLWELTAAHPAHAVEDLFVQMLGEDLAMIGLSFSVPVPDEGSADGSQSKIDGQKIKFSFACDPEDPNVPITGGTVSGSVFYERTDGVRFSMSADLSGYSLVDMAGKGMGAFLDTVETSGQCMAYEPGVLDARDLSAEEKSFVIDLARACLVAADTGLRAIADHFRTI